MLSLGETPPFAFPARFVDIGEITASEPSHIFQ